ncbi:MAG: DNA-formamidopyrimidine glycosylase family protein, partial [Acholeplasmataceae bacterium]
MPELPEVETVRRTLEPLLVNKRIENVHVFHQNMIETSDFEQKLKGQTIQSIDRMGKFLIFKLSQHVMISHLRMEGKYFLTDPRKKHPHEHVIFYLDDGQTLIYHDVRKFGKFQLRSYDDYVMKPPLVYLGPEP